MSESLLERGRNWPGGVSDGLSLPCSICHQKVYFDYHVDDNTWRRVAPINHRRDVICLPCFDLLSKEKNIDATRHVVNVQFTGTRSTLVLLPSKTVRFTDGAENYFYKETDNAR